MIRWLLSKADWWYSNGWYYEEPEDLDCELAEDKIMFGFYEVTHVLTNPLAHPDLAEPSTTSLLLEIMYNVV